MEGDLTVLLEQDEAVATLAAVTSVLDAHDESSGGELHLEGSLREARRKLRAVLGLKDYNSTRLSDHGAFEGGGT